MLPNLVLGWFGNRRSLGASVGRPGPELPIYPNPFPGCSEILGIVSRESSAAASRSHGSGDENFRLFPSSTLCCWEATERKNLIKVQGLVDGIFAARRTVPCQIHQNRVDLRRFWLSKQGHPNHICWLLYVPL